MGKRGSPVFLISYVHLKPCKDQTYFAPASAIRFANLASSPGLSPWMHEKRHNLPSMARARTITRPTTAMSMFPPQRMHTTLCRNLVKDELGLNTVIWVELLAMTVFAAIVATSAYFSTQNECNYFAFLAWQFKLFPIRPKNNAIRERKGSFFRIIY